MFYENVYQYWFYRCSRPDALAPAVNNESPIKAPVCSEEPLVFLVLCTRTVPGCGAFLLKKKLTGHLRGHLTGHLTGSLTGALRGQELVGHESLITPLSEKLAIFQGPLSGGGFKGGFPDLDLSFLFCPFSSFLGLSRFFRDFPDLSGDSSGIFPICDFLFLGLLTAPTRNSPERVCDTIWTFPEKSGKPPGLDTPQFSFSQIFCKTSELKRPLCFFPVFLSRFVCLHGRSRYDFAKLSRMFTYGRPPFGRTEDSQILTFGPPRSSAGPATGFIFSSCLRGQVPTEILQEIRGKILQILYNETS